MLKESEITNFINQDILDSKKRYARIAEKYYNSEHDIKNYRLYYYDANGELQEDKTRSNIKISHPFFTELVDQEAQYILSTKKQFIKSDISELQHELDKYFNYNDDFISELYETITDTIVKGFGFLYAYKDKNDRIAFQSADSLGVVEVRAKDTDDGCEYVIYWYVDRIEKSHKKIKRIQVWDKNQTFFYVQEDDGNLILDDSQPLNPRPHVTYTKGDDDIYYENFGFIPFFRLDNNGNKQSGLKSVKELIDDYDLMSCGLSNNIQDGSEMYWVVKGFKGDNLDEMITNIKSKKHVGVESDGDVSIKTVEIPYQARKVKLEEDEKNIYRFGMGFNSTQLGDGNVTNVVIKSRYALLDLKCNKLEIRLKAFLRKIIDIVLKEINERNSTDYQSENVFFEFERNIITNSSDNAQIELVKAQTEQVEINTLLGLASVLGNDILVQRICEALDLDYEEIKDKLPKQETIEDLLGEGENV